MKLKMLMLIITVIGLSTTCLASHKRSRSNSCPPKSNPTSPATSPRKLYEGGPSKPKLLNCAATPSALNVDISPTATDTTASTSLAMTRDRHEDDDGFFDFSNSDSPLPEGSTLHSPVGEHELNNNSFSCEQLTAQLGTLSQVASPLFSSRPRTNSTPQTSLPAELLCIMTRETPPASPTGAKPQACYSSAAHAPLINLKPITPLAINTSERRIDEPRDKERDEREAGYSPRSKFINETLKAVSLTNEEFEIYPTKRTLTSLSDNRYARRSHQVEHGVVINIGLTTLKEIQKSEIYLDPTSGVADFALSDRVRIKKS